jgi:hypothetical protein
MLRAGTFIYALFIMFIVSMLTLLFLSQTRLYSDEISRMQVRERLEENCISAINYALAMPSKSFQGATDIDLFGRGGDSVSIRKYTWGLMDVISVQAKHRGQRRNKTALLGYRPADSLKTALYLSNSESALHISGETRIKGNVFLPEAGVKRAYIAGASYFGDSLIYGKQFLSEKNLPLSIDAKGWDALEQLPVNEIPELEVIENSFADSTMILTDFAEIYLEEITLKGNILISSDTLVEIHPTAVLEDVIVKAPVIRVKKGTNISAQLLAADTLIIEEDCVLHYPSVIAVRSEKRGFITIAGNSKVYGDLWYKSSEDPGKTSIDVNIDKEASLTGRLMTEQGNLQLRGKVTGEVYAEDFILHHPVGIYKNHLLSVQIDRRALWKPYLFPIKAREKDKANVIKWLKE